MTSPTVVLGRPRSGSRLVARLLRENGIFMGSDLNPESLDSYSWHQCFVAPLITGPFFPSWQPNGTATDLRSYYRNYQAETLRRFWAGRPPSAPWGWKVCETLFVIPVVKELFPEARFIHVIRDGRDVCLSNRGFFQLTAACAPNGWFLPGTEQCCFRDFCIAVTFGESGIREWRGLDLYSPHALVDDRYSLQVQSWITCVTRAQAYGRMHPGDYYEIRYEDLCRAPTIETNRLFEWLHLPIRQPLKVGVGRIQKWQNTPMSMRERRDFDRAVELARPLLKELAYVD